ncbi:uncharacterized protein [Dermacentor andersoni]|uniref:uncharacterized protein isoform X1 n=1 Tax=Dermacentor andersoni TaxID=34620 RepID=UPI0024160A09|nr:uncharacterized protein LOC126533321 isoform X1 [Dermacentor andersoni]
MRLQFVLVGLLLCLYTAQGTPPLFRWLPNLFTPPSLANLLPFPLALPLALVGPLPFALPLLVGLKGAGLVGVGFATGGAAGAGLAGLGALGLKAALINSAALKIAGLGAMTAKAKLVTAAAKAAAEAGVKAVVQQAKSKIATAPVVARVAPAAPVVAAPTLPVVPAVTNVKIIKTPPVITARPVPVDPWKVGAALPAGWDHSIIYGHPFFGYGFTRSAIELRKLPARNACPTELIHRRRLHRLRRRSLGDAEGQTTVVTPSGSALSIRARRREAPVTDAAAAGMNPQMLKNIFEYVTSYDAERCVLRVVCEVAAQPSLAGPQGRNVADFMTSLSKDDSGAPWMPYRDAALTGHVSADRTRCHERYPTCSQSTETLVKMAQTRIAQVSESVSGAATRI